MIGPPQRFRNRHFKYHVKFNISDTDIPYEHYIAYFVSCEECFDYVNDYGQIRNFIDRTTNDLRRDHLTTNDWDIIALSAWIPMVDRFIEKWSSYFVTPDIRKVYSAILAYNGRVPFEWPEIVTINTKRSFDDE